MTCLICGQSNYKDIFWEEGVAIKRCLDCGHVFSAYQGSDDYDAYFPQDIAQQDHFWWQEAHMKMYADFCQRFMAGDQGRILDFACGLGYFLKFLRDEKSVKTWEAHGVEISQPAADFARQHLGLNNIFNGSLKQANYPKKYFNLITLWDVLEHLSRPDDILQQVKDLLTDDGYLFIATPNIQIQLPKARLKKIWRLGRPGHYLEARDYLHIYSPSSLSRLLKRNGYGQGRFLQLPPIQAVSGSRNLIGLMMKKVWHLLATAIFHLSGRRINFNNLYFLVKKQ